MNVTATDSTDTPACLPTLLIISFLYFLVFLFFHFLVVGSVQQIKMTRVSFEAHAIIASYIVSYRTARDRL